MPRLSSLVTSVGCHRILRFTTGIFLLLLFVLGMPVEAAIYTVTNLNNSGAGSLRQAILDAEDNSSSDTIVFAVNNGTIFLNSELPAITREDGLTIDGAGQKITVSGGGAVRIMEVDGGTLTLKNLTLINGSAPHGGAIQSNKLLTVINCTFSNNKSAGTGGAIDSNTDDSKLTVVNSTFFGNSAPRGGGIYNESGEVTITNSTFSGNSATATGNRGGNSIFNVPGGTVNLQNTIMVDDGTGYNCSSNYRTITFGGLAPGATSGISLSGVNLSTDTTNLSTNICTAHVLSNPNLKTSNDPGLSSSLVDNGGWTETLALLDGSPAIDAADDAICAAAPVNNRDQRGAIRPAGAHCDIGAYEAGAEIPVATTAAIPTLSEWALLMLSGLLGLSVIVTLRRRSPANWRA